MDPVAATLAARYPAPDIDITVTRDTRNEAQSSGVSWAAVSAGAFVAAALSLSLLALGTGLGFTAISPWSGEGASAAGIGIASIVWLILMQIIAAAMGGYVAGRLRTKWTDVNNDEVFFRDTAHGFLVWAVGLVITAAFLASAASSVIGGTAQVGAAAAGAAVSAGGAAVTAGVNAQSQGDGSGPIGYFVDGLFRGDRTGPAPNAAGSNTVGTTTAASNAAENGADVRAEALRILANGWEEMPDVDKTYLAGLIADNTGITLSEAESRINDAQARMKEIETQARQAADTARKAVVHLSLWMFLGLLIGAFSASFAATVGGRQRDNVSV